MDILTDENNVEIIAWLPHGNGFIIHKKRKFADDILPKFFKASKFTSFTRKLNRWGFSRVPRGPECGSYFHRVSQSRMSLVGSFLACVHSDLPTFTHLTHPRYVPRPISTLQLFRRDKPTLCLQMTSNSGNKYQSNPQQLLPAGGGPGMMQGGMPNGGVAYPFMNMPNGTPQQQQQQQAMWQHQMQQMMQMQQMHMMQMQQHAAGQGAVAPGAEGEGEAKKEEGGDHADDPAPVEDGIKTMASPVVVDEV